MQQGIVCCGFVTEAISVFIQLPAEIRRDYLQNERRQRFIIEHNTEVTIDLYNVYIMYVYNVYIDIYTLINGYTCSIMKVILLSCISIF